MTGALTADLCVHEFAGQGAVNEDGLPFMMSKRQSSLDEFFRSDGDRIR